MLKRLLLTTLALSLLAHSCFAATEFVSIINSAALSEDYGSLSSWEAAMDDAGDLTDGTVKTGNWDNQTGGVIADAAAVDWDGGASTGTLIHMRDNGATGIYLIDVTGGSLADDDVILDVATSTDGFTIDGAPDSAILVAECYDDDGDLNNDVDINGNTTSATNFLKITVPVGERHDGTDISTGFKLISDASTNECISVVTDNTIIEWIMIDRSTNSSFGRNALDMENGTDDSFLRNSIIRAENNSSGQNGAYGGFANNGGTATAQNCIFIGGDGAGSNPLSNLSGGGNGINIMLNCTFYNSDGQNVTGNFGAKIVKNCLSLNAGSNCYNNVTLTTCGSSDLTGSAGLQSLVTGDEVVDITSNAENLHLKSGATSIDAGTDLGAGNEQEVDIDGRDRDAEGDIWDLGADEFVAAVAAANPQIISIN